MSIVLKNWVRVSDAVTADPDYFVTAARPNTSATMAQTSLSSNHNGGGRNVTVTTSVPVIVAVFPLSPVPVVVTVTFLPPPL